MSRRILNHGHRADEGFNVVLTRTEQTCCFKQVLGTEEEDEHYAGQFGIITGLLSCYCNLTNPGHQAP